MFPSNHGLHLSFYGIHLPFLFFLVGYIIIIVPQVSSLSPEHLGSSVRWALHLIFSFIPLIRRPRPPWLNLPQCSPSGPGKVCWQHMNVLLGAWHLDTCIVYGEQWHPVLGPLWPQWGNHLEGDCDVRCSFRKWDSDYISCQVLVWALASSNPPADYAAIPNCSSSNTPKK